MRLSLLALPCAGALLVSNPAAAQAWKLHDAVGAPSNLKLSGAVRTRVQTVDNQIRPGVPTSETLYETRGTLFAEYNPGPVRFGVELWDSRADGADRAAVVSVSEVNAFEPVQAYVAADFKDAFGPGTNATVKAGRFVMDIGARRLVTNEDFRNTTNGFTGVRLDSRFADGSTLLAFYTAPQVRLPEDQAGLVDNKVKLDRESDDLLFWGLAGTHRGPAGFDLDASYLALRESDSPGRATRDRELTTLSARALRAPRPGRFDAEAEGGWQTGEISASAAVGAPKLDVAAGFVHLRVGYQFNVTWTPRVALEYDWVSGDDAGGDYTRFDTLFGSRRGDFAPAGIYNLVGRANLNAPALRLEATPNRRTEAFITLRPMWLASATDGFSTSNIRDTQGRSGDYAGFQAEGRVRYWLVPDTLRLELNGAVLNKGRFLRTAPNAPRGAQPPTYAAASLMWSF